MKEKIRALIVDDEPKARRDVRGLLDADTEIEVVAECANGRDAIDAINTLGPHLVFLDVLMPRITGFERARSDRQGEDAAGNFRHGA